MKSEHRSRLVEWGKNLLILLLALSALYLLARTQFSGNVLDSVRDLLTKTPTSGSDSAPAQFSAAVQPVRLAVYQNGQRYGVQYDQTGTDAAYAECSTLLAEALSSAGQPTKISESVWRNALCRTGIYVDYLSILPLDALSGWLGGDQINSVLTGSARHICLAEDETHGVSLFYIDADDNSYYACKTTLSVSSHLNTAISGITPNGALFAFEMPDMDILDPYTLLTTTPQAKIYTAANPLLEDSTRVSELLSALTFHAQNAAPDPVMGGQFVEGNDFLRLSSHGVLSYHTVGDSDFRFLVSDNSAQGTLDYVRALAQRTVGAWCGQARLYLAGMEDTDSGLEITFQYCLNGSPVSLSEDCAARFTVQNGAVTDFTLYLRSYTDTKEISPILPVQQAAAAMESLNTDGSELTLLYQDTGGDLVSAYWAAS